MKRLLFLHIALLSAVLSWAQATGIPYSCSFEEKEDLSNWVLNYHTPTATDKWIYGNAVHSDGQRSMYISTNRKATSYGSNPNIVVSFLRFKFPTETKQKNYTISFDWKGIGDSATSRLFVMVCPEALALSTANSPYYLDNIVSSTSGTLPNNVVQACEQLGASRERFVCGSDQWQNVSLSNEIKVASIRSTDPFVIAFIWVNNNMDETVRQSGICIDNVQICSATIKKPYNMTVESVCEDSAMLVNWECSGVSTEFEVQYRKTGASTWRRADGLSDGVDGFSHSGTHYSYVLQRIGEGTYDVRVCNKYITKDTTYISSYAYKNQQLVFCPENHCVNYIDLEGPNVTCTYGLNPNKTSSPSGTPFDYQGVINYGPDAETSRHTIHVDPMETDPRTDDCLSTVPKGALASVRLGNWKTSAEAEAITYDIVVDAANQGLLIVKYAVVLENPGSHPHDEEPSFLMEVIDEHGELIDESCGRAEFSYSDGVEAGWNMTKDEKAAWKDWTTIGVNLQPYHGQTVRLRFTTFDCAQGGHYGYAYFTVDCVSAHLETDNCGNDSKIECYAPEGFAYSWYKGDPDAPGNKPFWFERELVTDPGRQEYTCRVSFIEDPNCYFDVSTVSEPRFPVPDYTFDRLYGVLGDGSPDPCTSRLKFHNKSHVMTKYDGEEQHTTEPTNDCHWWFKRLSDGTTSESYNWNPVYLCPPEGDSIEVTLITYIGVENACDSPRVDTIVVPDIMPISTVHNVKTCPETPVKFGDQWFYTDTTYVGIYPNFAGCDSTSTLHLSVYPKVEDTYQHDSICSDGYILINGIKYNQPMDSQLFVLKTVNGCDSLLYMTLTVNERIDATVDQVPLLCADDGQLYLTFSIAAGMYDSLVITFSTPELRDTVIYDLVSVVTIPYPETVTPGHYTATFEFYQFCCGVYTEKRDIEMHYRANVVEQKWNDVLAILAPEYNGGYSFKAFQWYKNGQPLPGETKSYLYQDLDFNATYYVELTRTDGVTITTCPMQPVYHEQQSEYPTVVKAARHMPMYMAQPATIWYYTMSGQLYSTFTLPQGYTTLATPDHPGVYVIKSVNAQGETKAQVMIVE